MDSYQSMTENDRAAPVQDDSADVNMYRGRSRSRSRSPPRREPPAARRHPVTEPTRVLGVFGLSFETRESDLRSLFEKYGELEKVTIVYDKRSGASRGFGFVYFVDQQSAEKAVPETNGINFQGRPIRVDFSATQKPHDPTPGRYMGEVTRRDERRGGRRRSRSRSRDRYRRSSRSRSRSRDRRSYYPPPSSGSSRYHRSPDRHRYRSRSRSVERRYNSSSRYSPRRRSPSPRRSPPRRYSPRR